jgi:DNA topoisomerase-1
MEKQLDEIVDGNNSRLNLLDGFYTQFNDLYQVATKEMSRAKPVETGELCPTCSSPLVVRKSKFGEFIACSNFPTCHYVKPKEIKKLEVLDNEVCPKCGKELVKRTSKNGDFFACSGFPKCRYIKGQEEQAPKQDVVSDINCPKCGKPLLIKKGRNNKGDFLACSGFPKCRHIQSIK